MASPNIPYTHFTYPPSHIALPQGILWPWLCACLLSGKVGNAGNTFRQQWWMLAGRYLAVPWPHRAVLRCASDSLSEGPRGFRPSLSITVISSLLHPSLLFLFPLPNPLTILLVITFYTQSSSLRGIQSKVIIFNFWSCKN